MASRGKKKTTMAKLSRESKLRERRLDKAARKEARRNEALNAPDGAYPELDDSAAETDPDGSALDETGPAVEPDPAGVHDPALRQSGR
jgi:hypothetical protein